MDCWGQQMFKTNITIAEMTAIALGLDKDALSKTFVNGANYLSPPCHGPCKEQNWRGYYWLP